MATPTLLQGTKEFLEVDIEDLSKALGSLSGTTPKYDVIDDLGAFKYTAANCSLDSNLPMSAFCLVDTLQGGAWVGAGLSKTFRLYVYFVTGSESPRTGPYTFIVQNV